jgi:ribosomal protein S18 acetylase RimI-like enzyme
MHPLDNPIWQALTTSQSHFARTAKSARRFPSDVTTLGGFPETTQECYDSLASILDDVKATGLFFDLPPQPPAGWTILTGAPLFQMIQQNGKVSSPSQPQRAAPEFIELTAADAPEMLALAQLTKPGPFGLRTRELGTYLGIRQDGQLIAMAGERLHVPSFTEISAVCTHPDHTGRGHAAALMTELAHRIRARGEIPFLHVREDNTRAISLYEHLGYQKRVLLHFAVVRKLSQDPAA